MPRLAFLSPGIPRANDCMLSHPMKKPCFDSPPRYYYKLGGSIITNVKVKVFAFEWWAQIGFGTSSGLAAERRATLLKLVRCSCISLDYFIVRAME